jgi:hypothetical protein
MFAILLTDPTRGQLILRDIPLEFGCTFRYPTVELIHVYILCIFSSALREEWKIITCTATGATVTSCASRLYICIKYQAYSVHICSSICIVRHTSLFLQSYILNYLLEVKYTQANNPADPADSSPSPSPFPGFRLYTVTPLLPSRLPLPR